jgi:ABC-type transport system involved in multi-copper enzyme maturation permease subunit
MDSKHVFRAVLRHEVGLHLSNPAHLIVTVLMMVIIVLALYRGGKTYAEQRQAVDAAQRASNAMWASNEPDQWLTAATRGGRWIYSMPLPSSVWTDGVSKNQPQGYRVRVGIEPAHRLDLTDGQQSWNPQISRFGSLDLGFVLLVLAPLWVILLTFDAVSGEKVRGTLKVLFSYPLSRRAYLNGRVVGLLIWMLGPVLAALAVGLAMNAASGHFSGGFVDPVRLGLVILLVVVYLLFFAMTGLWASASTTDPRMSLMVLMVVWVAITFFIPRISTLVGAQLHPPMTHMDLAVAKRAVLEEARRSDEGHGAMSLSQAEAQILRVEQIIPRETELDREFAERKSAAEAVGIRLALVSPMVAGNFALMDLAGTGPNRYDNFLRQVGEYRRELSLYYADRIRAQEQDKSAVLANVPSFLYREEPDGAMIGRTMPKIMWIGLMAALLYLASIKAFNRYDLR